MLASSALAVIEAFMGHSGESLRGQQLAPLWAAAATVMKMATKAMRMLFMLCCVLYVYRFYLPVNHDQAFGGCHTAALRAVAWHNTMGVAAMISGW